MDAVDGQRDWAGAQPALVVAVGDDTFPAQLDAALRLVAPFDLSCAFAYPTAEKPHLLHNGLGAVSPPEIMRNYLSGTYLLDAVYTACRRQTPAGLYRLAELAPDAFFEGEYYNSPDVHPCISMESGVLAEEIVFLARTGQGVDLAYSLLRQNGSPVFSDNDLAALRVVAYDRTSPGYIDNKGTQTNDANEVHQTGGRVLVTVKPVRELTATVVASTQKTKQDDFSVPEIDFSAQADSSGTTLGDIYVQE